MVVFALVLEVSGLLWSLFAADPSTPRSVLISTIAFLSLSPPPCALSSPGPHINIETRRPRRRCSQGTCFTECAHLHSALPTRFTPPAYTIALLLMNPPPPRHKLAPWQQDSPHAAALIAPASPRPSPCIRILTHVSHQSEAL